jgi:hypothetical protein
MGIQSGRDGYFAYYYHLRCGIPVQAVAIISRAGWMALSVPVTLAL